MQYYLTDLLYFILHFCEKVNHFKDFYYPFSKAIIKKSKETIGPMFHEEALFCCKSVVVFSDMLRKALQTAVFQGFAFLLQGLPWQTYRILIISYYLFYNLTHVGNVGKMAFWIHHYYQHFCMFHPLCF